MEGIKNQFKKKKKETLQISQGKFQDVIIVDLNFIGQKFSRFTQPVI